MMQTWARSGPLPTLPFVHAYLVLSGANSAAGLSTSQVLNYCQTRGIDGYRITSLSRVRNYKSRSKVEQAMRNGVLFATVNLPTADLELATQVSATWTTYKAPVGVPASGGHALAMIVYSSAGPVFVTWSMSNWSFNRETCGALQVQMSCDCVET